MKRLPILVILYLLLCSHELFLKIDSYYLNTNQSTELYLFNGTFDKSENVITRERIVNARIVGPQYDSYPNEADYYDKGTVTYLRFKAGGTGTYMAGVSTLPKIIELSASDFKEYLEHEGLTNVIAKREDEGVSNTSAREKYSKHVKAILQVSDTRTNHFGTEFGYPIEFVPLNNPYNLSKGDSISFKLLSNGKPLPDQVVHYSSRSGMGDRPIGENSTRTDKNGVLTMELNTSGKWYVATIHMTESEEDEIDYESNWATMTFEIK